MRLRLSDEDRARLGGPEWLEIDLSRLSVAEAEALEAAGLSWQSFITGGLPGILARVWVGLLRAGATLPEKAADLDINLAGYAAEDTSPGKAPSARRSTPTRSRSATTPPAKAGRSSRGKSPS